MMRRTVYFSGRVQGVGFRYTTRRVAGAFVVTGFVRNLRDGRVELVAEGEEAELDRFIAAVERAMADRIASQEMTESSPTGAFRAFEIGRDA